MRATVELVMAPQLPDIQRMSIAAEKVAEALAMPVEDRAFLARKLIASLDGVIDAEFEETNG